MPASAAKRRDSPNLRHASRQPLQRFLEPRWASIGANRPSMGLFTTSRGVLPPGGNQCCGPRIVYATVQKWSLEVPSHNREQALVRRRQSRWWRRPLGSDCLQKRDYVDHRAPSTQRKRPTRIRACHRRDQFLHGEARWLQVPHWNGRQHQALGDHRPPPRRRPSFRRWRHCRC